MEGAAVAVMEHKNECVAGWTYLATDEVIACTGCGQRYPATPERRFAADFESILTLHMNVMAAEGFTMLARQKPTRPRWTP
jgi:hypothetical protein